MNVFDEEVGPLASPDQLELLSVLIESGCSLPEAQAYGECILKGNVN